jgi:hypothetical protein
VRPRRPARRNRSPPVPQVRDETAELRTQVAQLDEHYRRAVADFDNLGKRMARNAHWEREDERARVAARWLRGTSAGCARTGFAHCQLSGPHPQNAKAVPSSVGYRALPTLGAPTRLTLQDSHSK